MTISHHEAQELHESIGYALEAGTNTKEQREALTRAREIAAIIVSDTMPN